jgi:hypothetical protein
LRDSFVYILDQDVGLFIILFVVLLQREDDGVSVDHIVVHFLETLFGVFLFVEGQIAISQALARLSVKDHLGPDHRVSLDLEHFVQVEIIEGVLGQVPNVYAGEVAVLPLLVGRGLLKLHVLESLDKLISRGLGEGGTVEKSWREPCRGMGSCWVWFAS